MVYLRLGEDRSFGLGCCCAARKRCGGGCSGDWGFGERYVPEEVEPPVAPPAPGQAAQTVEGFFGGGVGLSPPARRFHMGYADLSDGLSTLGWLGCGPGCGCEACRGLSGFGQTPPTPTQVRDVRVVIKSFIRCI